MILLLLLPGVRSPPSTLYFVFFTLEMVKMKKQLLPLMLALSLSTGAAVVPFTPVLAAGTVPADVQTGIDDATATVSALGSISLAALVVALVPFGSMLTLRFLHMVLARV